MEKEKTKLFLKVNDPQKTRFKCLIKVKVMAQAKLKLKTDGYNVFVQIIMTSSSEEHTTKLGMWVSSLKGKGREGKVLMTNVYRRKLSTSPGPQNSHQR